MTWAMCSDPAIGYDVSHHQGMHLPWKESVALGLKWAISKAFHGRHFVTSASVQLASAASAGVELLGEYGWLLPDENIAQQIKEWNTGNSPGCDLPISIDFEDVNTRLRGAPLVQKLELAIEIISDDIGQRPINYTGEWYWKQYCFDVDSEIVASCPLWFAAYPRKSATGMRYQEAANEVCGGVLPRIPVPWRNRDIEPVMWQFDGDKGLYLPNGADIDVNIAAWSRLLEIANKQVTFEAPPTLPSTAANPLGWETRAEYDRDKDDDK